MIEEARSTIHITTYILGWDEASRAILERLAERAREGVSVRLLIDDLGSWRLPRRKLAPLTQAGARVAFFMPVFHVPLRGRANLRNHRKLIVVDGRTSLDRRHEPGIAVHGAARRRARSGATSRRSSRVPLVADLEALFASDWKFATGSEPGSDPESERTPIHQATGPRRPRSSRAGRTSPATRSMSRCSRLIFAATGPDLDRDPVLRPRRDAGPGPEPGGPPGRRRPADRADPSRTTSRPTWREPATFATCTTPAGGCCCIRPRCCTPRSSSSTTGSPSSARPTWTSAACSSTTRSRSSSGRPTRSSGSPPGPGG